MERTKEELEQLANDVIALNTPDKQPASKAAGYVLQEAAIARIKALEIALAEAMEFCDDPYGNPQPMSGSCVDFATWQRWVDLLSENRENSRSE
jgi:hypothetical protein